MKIIIAAFRDSVAADRGAEHVRSRIADDDDAKDYRVNVIGHEDAGADPLASLHAYHVPQERAHTYAELLRRGAKLLIAQVPDRRAADLAKELDELGSLDLDAAESRWRSEGWTGYDESDLPFDANSSGDERAALDAENPTPTQLDVVQEKVRIGKREVPRGGVRVRTTIVERPVHETVELHEEHIDVTREPVNEPLPASAADAHFTEEEFEITATGEEVVVGKEAHVVERVQVGKSDHVTTEEVNETERRRDVNVEEIDERDRTHPPRR